MNQPPCGNEMDGGNWNATPERQEKWACPLFKAEPRRHSACMHYKGGRISDVRQHLDRKHPEEAKNMKKDKDKKKKTNIERWYDVWNDLFPGQAGPETPYAGSGDGDLLRAWIMEYIQRGGDVVSADGLRALMRCLNYVNTISQHKGPGNISGPGEVSEQPDIPGRTHQYPSQSANSFEPIMDSFELRDPRFVLIGVDDAPMSGTMMEPQALSNFEANGQRWALPGNSGVYPSGPTHQFGTAPQLPPNGWVNVGLENGYADAPTVPVDPTGDMYPGSESRHTS